MALREADAFRRRSGTRWFYQQPMFDVWCLVWRMVRCQPMKDELISILFFNRTWRFWSRYQTSYASPPFCLYIGIVWYCSYFSTSNFLFHMAVPTDSHRFLRVETVLRLHNMVEDLKGSIRVFCRVRPLSQYLRRVLSVESHVRQQDKRLHDCLL